MNIFFTVLGLAQSQYTFAERSTFYSLALRLLSPSFTLLLGRPRLRLLGIPGTASGKTRNTAVSVAHAISIFTATYSNIVEFPLLVCAF